MSYKYPEKIIFVVGSSRSGTTMVAKLLSYSGKVHFFNELHFYEQLCVPKEEYNLLTLDDAEKLATKLYSIEYDGYLQRSRDLDKWRLEAQALLSYMKKQNILFYPFCIYGSFLSLESKKHGRQIPCDQTPRNVFYLKEILGSFPNAKVINMIRDPRDVLLSQKYKWKLKFTGLDGIPYYEVVRSWMNYNPIIISNLWLSSVKAYQEYSEDDRVYNLYFEELLKKPEEKIKNMCDFLKIPFSQEMLKVEYIHSSTEDNKILRRGLDKRKIGKWEKGGLNRTEIFLCQHYNQKMMRIHNYVPVKVRYNPILLFYYYLNLPLKLSIALMLNIGRVKNLKEAIKRRIK